jgi:hypothetical protein
LHRVTWPLHVLTLYVLLKRANFAKLHAFAKHKVNYTTHTV